MQSERQKQSMWFISYSQLTSRHSTISIRCARRSPRASKNYRSTARRMSSSACAPCVQPLTNTHAANRARGCCSMKQPPFLRRHRNGCGHCKMQTMSSGESRRRCSPQNLMRARRCPGCMIKPGRAAIETRLQRDASETDRETLWEWNVVERSQHGHERRHRLGWRMTDSEAAEWSAVHGVRLERA